AKPIREQHPSQQFARPEEVLLPDELIQRAGTHPRGKRLGAAQVGLVQIVEQVDGSLSLLIEDGRPLHCTSPVVEPGPALVVPCMAIDLVFFGPAAYETFAGPPAHAADLPLDGNVFPCGPVPRGERMWR